LGNKVGGVDVLNDIVITVQSVNVLSVATISVTGLPGWITIPYVPVTLSGTNSLLDKQGIITLYKKDSTNNYLLVDSIVSPMPASNEQFGSTLTFGDNELFVGAIGNNNNAGKVYKLKYSTVINTSTAYNPVGSSNATLVVTGTAGIKVGMEVQGIGFTSGQLVLSVINDTTLVLNGSPTSTPSGVLNFVTTSWRYSTYNLTVSGNSYFGISVQISNSGTILAISALGTVYIYRNTGTDLVLEQTLTGLTSRFGYGVTISNDATYIAISDDIESTATTNQEGCVKIYFYNGTNYVLYQTIVNHSPEVAQRFGNKMFFMNDYSTLVIYSQEGDTRLITTFDDSSTTFDKDSTTFVTPLVNSGRIDVYDRYLTKWVYSSGFAFGVHDSGFIRAR
jgi:hypothetical protein